MDFLDLKFWAGTEESLLAYLSAIKQVAAMDASQIKASYDEDSDDKEPSRLLSMQGDVAVLSISGPLVQGAKWYNKYMGVTGYGEIREALVQAAMDDKVGAILLDIASGGGAVAGVTDVVDLIRQVDAVKPVHTYSDSMMASAAYWIGSSARRMEIGRVAEAGSIGVITIHKEVTKMLTDAGITPTVLRAGEFKGMGNPYEKLTDKGREVIQAQLDQMYRMFVGHVAERRGISYETADAQLAQGKVFIGDRAVAANLVDGVSTFDSVVSRIQGAIDSEKNRSQYGANFGKGPVVKTALTEQQLAAMAEGAGFAAQASAEPEAAPAAPTAPVEAGGAAEASAQAPAAPAAEPAAEPAAPQADAGVVAYLQSQLAEANAKVLDMTIELRDSKAASAAMQNTHSAFRALAVASLDRLKVAMGGSPASAEGMSDEAILAEHSNLRAQFESKFKAGGVAAVSSSGSAEKKAEPTVDSVRLARIKATRPSK